MQSSLARLSAIASLLPLVALPAACSDDAAAGGGGAGAGDTGGAGGSGGGGPVCGVEEGEIISAPADTWTWVDFPDSLCMNNTPTGIGVNLSATSDDVVIFLMGGNACFNNVSCAVTANTDGYGAMKFAVEDALAEELFDRTNPANPLRDYSYVFVPYCTGDVHAGDRADVTIGSSTWQFHGYKNMAAFLKRIVPTFKNASKVVLAGVSAGGFGAAFNYDQVATAFCPTPVVLIDDSGPPMGVEFVPACLQKHFVDTWGLAATLPSDCSDCVNDQGVFMEPMIAHIVGKYPDKTLGLISSEEDETIRRFWGYGENDCASLPGIPAAYPAAKYTQGLEDLRDRIIGDKARFKAFLVPGTEHVFLDDDPSMVTAGGVTLQTWLTQALNGDPAWDNVP
jgi:hypothetical protein